MFAAVKKGHDHFGRIDVVVANAGYGLFGMIEEITEEEARAQFGIKVTLIEPTGFNTNFFGGSSKFAKRLPAYEPMWKAIMNTSEYAPSKETRRPPVDRFSSSWTWTNRRCASSSARRTSP